MSESKLVPIKVRVKNFQSIEDLEIEVRGFTCVTGPTNIGKSALVRAVAYSALNKPVGGQVRHGAKFCTVEVSSEAGWSYRWEKGDRGVNRYTITDPAQGLAEKVFDKTGQAQLPEVERLGFGSVEVGSSELHPWWANQYKPVFLLGETGSAVTDFVSKVSRLAVLQDAITESSRGKKRENDSAKDCQAQAEQVKERLARVAPIDALARLKDELVEQAKSIREYGATVAALRSFKAKLEDAAGKIARLSPVSAAKVPAAPPADAVAALSELHRYWKSLESRAQRVIRLREVQKVSVPAPPEKEARDLSDLVRFSRLPALAASVKALAGAAGVSVPAAPPAGEMGELRSMRSYASRLGALAASVKALSGQVRVPDAPAGFDELASVRAFHDRLSREAAAVRELQGQLKKAEEAAKAAEAAVAAIPKCGTCGRPSAASHGHAA